MSSIGRDVIVVDGGRSLAVQDGRGRALRSQCRGQGGLTSVRDVGGF